MKEIFRFIEKYYFVLLFLIFEAISFSLIVNYNQTQEETFIASSNRFAASFLKISGNIKGYFSLRQTNEELSRENAYLRTQIPASSVRSSEIVISVNDILDPEAYLYHPAKVVYNTINKPNNYITLNRGSNHGITPESGVISARGLVGVVARVSANYSSVIPILNTKFKVSAKLRDTDFFGSLTWNGESYQFAMLSEIPVHAPIRVGEAVVTSGFSAIFPENILVGTIESFEAGQGEGFYNIKVKLSVDFKKLTFVEVVEKVSAKEQLDLEIQSLND